MIFCPRSVHGRVHVGDSIPAAPPPPLFSGEITVFYPAPPRAPAALGNACNRCATVDTDGCRSQGGVARGAHIKNSKHRYSLHNQVTVLCYVRVEVICAASNCARSLQKRHRPRAYPHPRSAANMKIERTFVPFFLGLMVIFTHWREVVGERLHSCKSEHRYFIETRRT